METEDSCCGSKLPRFAGASEAATLMDVSQAINFYRISLSHPLSPARKSSIGMQLPPLDLFLSVPKGSLMTGI